MGTEEQITSHAISFAVIFLQNKYSIAAFSRADSPSGSMVSTVLAAAKAPFEFQVFVHFFIEFL